MNVMTNNLRVSFNEETNALEIRHADPSEFQWPVVEIQMDTLSEMSFGEASQFVGERLLLLIPKYHEVFKDYLWTDDGNTPPKKELYER